MYETFPIFQTSSCICMPPSYTSTTRRDARFTADALGKRRAIRPSGGSRDANRSPSERFWAVRRREKKPYGNFAISSKISRTKNRT